MARATRPEPGLPDLERDRRLIEQIRRQLRDLDNHVPTLCEIASAVAMSPRTLRRRLKALGTCYSEVLREERYHLAAEWLQATSLTVDAIAERLGYTEGANFRRAFRRWMGCPPCDYRRSARRAYELVGQAA